MKEVTKIINVFSFDELSEKAKERACQQVGDVMTNDDGWWYEDIFDMFVERCKEYGMEVEKEDIYFTGFNSQGDGASFTCKSIDTQKLLHSLGIQINKEVEKKVLDYIYEVNISRTSNRTYHEQSVQAEVFIDDDALEEEDEGTIQDIQDVADTLEFKLEALKDDLCQQVYYELENEYDYIYSEYAYETAYCNNMLFLADGTVYDWGE